MRLSLLWCQRRLLKILDFRSISLVTSLFEIIARVLSGRLCKVIHETISNSQGAFVEGRKIFDVVLIANGVLDKKRRFGEEGVVLKIEFRRHMIMWTGVCMY